VVTWDEFWTRYVCDFCAVHATDVGRLLLAGLCGAVVGWEREAHEKAAGLRTHILLAVGACLFTLVAAKAQQDDMTRLIQGMVTGTGFLAGGVIFREGLSIRGLTTAVGLWLMGAIGLAVGMGEHFLGIVATIFMFITLSVLRHVEQRFARRTDKAPPSGT
jgi:putative Mg2+ transporter-C (MgtC) family protein